MLTALVIFTGVLVSWNVFELRQREFFTLLLLLVTGVFGVFASIDAFLLFFFYETAVLPMYLLIAVWGSTRKEYWAMKLTLFLFAGSAILMLLLRSPTGQSGAHVRPARLAAHAFDATFQHWISCSRCRLRHADPHLAAAHLVARRPRGAPTAVSMLHAGVLLKLGAYGLIRLGLRSSRGAGGLGVLIAIIGYQRRLRRVLGYEPDRPEVRLGYSSVSHMGYVLLGIAMGDRFGMTGAVFQMFAHGVMTGLFFALIGYVYEQTHTRVIADISGLMQRTPLVAACFIIAGASSMGLPSTAGFVAELLVYVGLVTKSPWLAALAFVGVVVTAAYVLRMLSRILLGEPSAVVDPIVDARPLRFTPMAILAGTIMLVGLFPASMYQTITSGVPADSRETDGEG